jgi:hypothetical protein
MESLSQEEMKHVRGGELPTWLECGAAAAGTAVFFAGIFSNPVTASGAVSAAWLGNAILGPTVTGVGVASCFA